MYENYCGFKLTQIVKPEENILWQGKPDKRCFILECIFNPMLPFALIWFLFDAFFIFAILSSGKSFVTGSTQAASSELIFMILFFAFHLMPVWIYLFGIIFSFKKYSNTEFIVTDKAVYISGGIFSYNCERKPIEKIATLQIRQGFFDRMLYVGDVIIERYTTGYGKRRRTVEHAIIDIPDFQNVYDLISDLQYRAQRRRTEEE